MAEQRESSIGGLVSRLLRPSVRYSVLALTAVGFVAGIIFWGGFNTAMEMTNTLEFCTSCHEMRDTVFQEYKKTIHFSNRSGVRAICSDCHVPHPWGAKVVRKIQASNELFHKLIGTVDTPEKFEAHRLELAKHVWATMSGNGSRECHNCHNFDAMSAEKQKPAAVEVHKAAKAENMACIECHKGIAHKLPEGG